MPNNSNNEKFPLTWEQIDQKSQVLAKRKTKWYEYVAPLLYMIVGVSVIFIGGNMITSPDIVVQSVPMRHVLELQSEGEPVSTKSELIVPGEQPTNPLETFAYAAVSMGAALLGMGFSLIPKARDKETDVLLASVLAHLANQNAMAPAIEKLTQPAVQVIHRGDVYDPDQDTPRNSDVYDYEDPHDFAR